MKSYSIIAYLLNGSEHIYWILDLEGDWENMLGVSLFVSKFTISWAIRMGYKLYMLDPKPSNKLMKQMMLYRLNHQ